MATAGDLEGSPPAAPTSQFFLRSNSVPFLSPRSVFPVFTLENGHRGGDGIRGGLGRSACWGCPSDVKAWPLSLLAARPRPVLFSSAPLGPKGQGGLRFPPLGPLDSLSPLKRPGTPRTPLRIRALHISQRNSLLNFANLPGAPSDAPSSYGENSFGPYEINWWCALRVTLPAVLIGVNRLVACVRWE